MEEIKIEQAERVLDDRYAWVSAIFGAILTLMGIIGALGLLVAIVNEAPVVALFVSAIAYLLNMALLAGVIGIVHILRVIEYSLRRDREERLLREHESDRIAKGESGATGEQKEDTK